MNLDPEAAMQDVYDVLIIGAGPGGATAALYTARAGLKTLVVHRGAGTGAYALAERIANYPGVPEEVPGDVLVARMNEQAASFGAQYVQDAIGMVDLQGDIKSASGNQGYYRGRTLIIATGAMGRGEPLPGEEQLVGRGVSYCATCDGAFFRDQEVAVAGNNNEAVEEALFLTRFASRVHLLSPTKDLLVPAELVEEVLHHEKMVLHRATRTLAILGNDEVTGVQLRDGDGERLLPVSGVFVFLQGRLPITGFLGDQIQRSEGGCLEVDDMMQTSVAGVFAVGDVLCNHLKQVVVAAADGAVAARGVERHLSGRSQIRPDWH
ncbi:MAG: FAD-dependent oxidoreductase [Chloroflexi bacterium]|nr:FAD-dependent oxidoreductase [Chloroflexota bacterium]